MKNYLRTSLCCLLLVLAAMLRAQTPSGLSVTFNRTGANGASVAVSVSDLAGHAVSGTTGTLGLSHDMKTSGTNITSGILCPNANGNTSPTIVFTLSLSGLPADFAFDGIGLDIHALNGSGAYQYNNDSKARKFNVREQIVTDGTPADFATLSDIDIAAGVGSEGNVHQVWTASGTMATAAAGTLTLTLTVTAGTSNVGCFFGLSEIRFTNSEAPEPTPDPEPEPDPNGRIVNLKWKNTAELYMTEEADGSLVVAEYDTSRRMFWQLVPTDAENVYYVRNTATGRYIQSCNLTPSSASKLKTVDTPVPYYMGRTASTAAEITGCYYFSSTDCTNYSNEAASPRALNKDGASSSIITWQAGPNNGTYRVGSYWKVIDTEDLYEARPFTPVSEKGNGTYLYNMVSTATGKSLQMNGEGTPEWQPLNESDEQTWYFVGESNRAGGYEIVCRSGDRTLTSGETDKWCIYPASTEEEAYFFRPYGADIAQTCALTVEGDSLFVYWQVTRGVEERNHVYAPDIPGKLWVLIRPQKLNDPDVPIAINDEEDTRFYHCNIKTLNLLPSVMTAQRAKCAGFDETVFHRGDIVTECSHSNVHIISGGKLITAPCDNLILPGITRAHILRICERLGIPVEERPFTLDEMMAADEVFFSSSSALTCRIREIDGKSVGMRDEKTFGAIRDAYQAEMKAECGVK